MINFHGEDWGFNIEKKIRGKLHQPRYPELYRILSFLIFPSLKYNGAMQYPLEVISDWRVRNENL